MRDCSTSLPSSLDTMASHYSTQHSGYMAPPVDHAASCDNALRIFWQEQLREIQQTSTDPAEFKNQQLPLTRIKKIMKSDEDVRMISAEAPLLFSKASEIFILELTMRAWSHAEQNKRRTLQKNDIDSAITNTDIFDFLVDIVASGENGTGEGVGPPPADGGLEEAQFGSGQIPTVQSMADMTGMSGHLQHDGQEANLDYSGFHGREEQDGDGNGGD